MIQQAKSRANNPINSDPAEQDHQDFRHLIRCVKIFGVACVIACVFYLLTREKNIAQGILGSVFVLLALYHTPFGLMVLFTFLGLENVMVFRPDFSYSKLIGIIVLVSYLLKVFRYPFVMGVPQRLILFFCLWCWASYFWCVKPDATMPMLQMLTLQIGVFFIMVNVIRDKKSFFVVLGGFAAGAIIISWLLMFGTVAYTTLSGEQMGRAVLAEGHSNPVIIGRAIAIGFIVTCLIFWKSNKILRYCACAVLALMFLALLTRTQSRLALFVAVLAPIFAFIMTADKRYRLKRLISAALIAGVAYFFMGFVLKSGLMTDMARDRFVSQGFKESGRLEMLADGLRLIASRPLHGYGIGNSSYARTGRGKGGSLHNNFVGLVADVGLVGLAPVVLLLIILYMQIYRITDPRLKWLGMAMLFYVVVSGITAVTYIQKDFWYPLQIAALTALLSRDEKRT